MLRNCIRLIIYSIMLLTVACVPQTTSTPMPAITSSVNSSPTKTPQPPTATSLPPTPTIGKVLVPGLNIERYYSNVLSPVLLRIGPNDEILLLDTESWEIHQLHPDGSLTVYASFPELISSGFVEHFDFDPSGRLWISTNHGGTFRISDNGSPERIAAANRWFAFNSQGIMYAVDSPSSNVHRITPDGQVSVLADGFGRAHNIAIGKNDEILVVEQDRGELIQIFDDGHWIKIAEGLNLDHSIAVSPEGIVYLVDWSGIQSVDLETGERKNLDWYEPFSNTGEKADFDSAGRMYTFHPNQPIYRLDLQAQTSEMVYHPRSNTWAMAVGPENRVFAAYGGLIPNAETTLYEIKESGVLVEIGSVPYRHTTNLTFGIDGTGYLAVFGPQGSEYNQPEFWGAMVYSFKPSTGAMLEKFQDTNNLTFALAVDPTTGNLWWTNYRSLQYRNGEGQVTIVDYPHSSDNSQPHYLTFAPNGTLYALIDLPADGNLQWHHRLYSRDPNGTWAEIVIADGPKLGLISQAICPNGDKFIMGYTWEVSTILKNTNRTGLIYAIWKLEENGELSLLAYDTGSDPFAASCDPDTNQVYYTTIDGIIRFYGN